MAHQYQFLPLETGHYPIIRSWLSEPHINGWWGDADTEIALMEEDRISGPTDMRIVALEGTPFAFVQDYPAHHWHMPHYADLPDDARAMDTFLGDPGYLGQGHASGYLRQRAFALSERFSTVAIDPSSDNFRAISAYRKAGFYGDRVAPCEDGDPVLVMTFQAECCT